MARIEILPIHADRPQPRIVQHDHRRYSVRLEQIFWRTLERLASAREQRLGALIAALAETYNGNNFSSYLRTYCIVELERARVASDLAARGTGIVEALSACPSPGIMLGPGRVVIAHNAAFAGWLGPDHAPVLEAPLNAHFQLRPAPALGQAEEAAAAGQAFEAKIQLVYTAPGRVSLAPGRLVALRGQEGQSYCLIWLSPSAPRPPATLTGPARPPRS
jgi:predicted DNA-binding ribbon-helix-helix protein